jgi:hypothetical protein
MIPISGCLCNEEPRPEFCPVHGAVYQGGIRVMEKPLLCANKDCGRTYKEHVNLYCPKTYPNYTMWMSPEEKHEG